MLKYTMKEKQCQNKEVRWVFIKLFKEKILYLLMMTKTKLNLSNADIKLMFKFVDVNIHILCI